jgi:hypothetical protein
MLYFFALVYGLIVMFILNCADRNVRLNRPHGRTLTVVGLSTLGASLVLAALLLAAAQGSLIIAIPA